MGFIRYCHFVMDRVIMVKLSSFNLFLREAKFISFIINYCFLFVVQRTASWCMDTDKYRLKTKAKNESRGGIFLRNKGLFLILLSCVECRREQNHWIMESTDSVMGLHDGSSVYRASRRIMLHSWIICSSMIMGFCPFDIQYSCVVKRDMYR